MPCTCWFDPPDASKRLIKSACKMIVDEIKYLQKDGDPIGLELKNVKELLDHLYDPESCKEKE